MTRADVARYAGVSTAVVSYVMNDGPKTVAPSTAARVREAIALLDYRPNVNAQALRRGKTRMIGLVLSDQANPFYAEFAAAIGAEAFAAGHALMIATTQGSEDVERRLVNDLLRRQVDGLIVASVFDRPDLVHARPQQTIPTVWLYAREALPGFPSVGPDGRRGAELGVSHLIEVHGHEQIGLVIGDIDDPRQRGWHDALLAAGLDPGPTARVAWSREGGYEGGLQLLSSRKPPTAIFASSDLQAVGLLLAAHERGLRVPEDLAVVAFDGTKESQFSWPPLTVVAQPIQDMARAAVRQVLDPAGPTGYQCFEPELIVRQSCGCSAPKTIPR